MTSPDLTDARRIEYLPLSEVAPATRNPKTHDVPALMRAVARFGFADAAILDERTGRLLGGHGRIDALKAMHATGRPVPDGIREDAEGQWFVPVQRGWSSGTDGEAEALLIALNRLPARGGWDSRLLAEILEDLGQVDPQLAEETGYTVEDLDRLLAEIAPRGAGTEPDAPGEFEAYDDETIPTTYACPRCAYRWSGKPE